MTKQKYPYTVCKKLSKYGERFTLRYHIKEECYQLSDSEETPMLIAKFNKNDRDLAVRTWERLEELYKENQELKKRPTENMFAVVEINDKLTVLGELKTNYILPFASLKSMCIILNYLSRNGDIPDVSVYEWWEKEEYQEYLVYDHHAKLGG